MGDGLPWDDEEEVVQNPLHYSELNEVPQNIQKYWWQRHALWSKYDEGVWMTPDAWFGVTPECVATQQAADISITAPSSKNVIVDAFGGAGANAIAFALSGRWNEIFCIEKDPETLKCAKHNAEIYGVAKKIWFIQGDCFEVIRNRLAGRMKEAVIFASPPWGGPSYSDDQIFDLESMQPYSIKHIMQKFGWFTKEIVLFVPRTSDMQQLWRYTTPGSRMKARHYCVKLFSKGICAFYGQFDWDKAKANT